MAATVHASKALGVSDRIGRLATGLIDVVLVEQDPLLSLEGLADPVEVFQEDGQCWARSRPRPRRHKRLSKE